jgi:hypothetical protein
MALTESDIKIIIAGELKKKGFSRCRESNQFFRKKV